MEKMPIACFDLARKIIPLAGCALLLSAPAPCQSQKNANPERVSSLKPLPWTKDAKVVATENFSDYTFEVNGDQLTVLNEEHLNLISMEGNVDYSKNIFYNDHLKIKENELKYASGKSVKKETYCGNYEVESVFYSDAKVCSYRFNILYSGTEVLFNSTSVYDDPKYLTRVFFHDDEPTALRQITFTVPSGVSVELVEKNFKGFDITKTVKQEKGNSIYKYVAKNLGHLKSESNSLGAMHHYPHLVVVTKQYTTSSGTKKVISSVDDLYRWYSGLVKEVKNDGSPMKQEVVRLTASAKTPEDKIKAIYYWVQDNIKYIAFEDGIAGFKPEAAQNVYNNRYGDCKGMANLTKEMLKLAGFDARLTWIGTNRIPYTYDLPSLSVDNHMICTLSLGDKLYILDSTEKYIALGKNAERIQGKEMLIENGDKFIRNKVPVSDFNANSVARNEVISLEGETLKGQGKLTLNGEAKKNILYYSTNVKKEDHSKIFDNLAVAEYSNTDKVEVINTPPVDREKPLEIDYSYALTNKVSKFGKDVYITMDWNKTYQDMEIDADRVSDYYFSRKVKMKVSKKLKIPTGYKVTYLPVRMSRKHPDFSFEVSYQQVGNDIVYANEITVPQGLVKKENFPIWNDYIKELKKMYDEQLVLTKTN
jgi:hypothetical protein